MSCITSIHNRNNSLYDQGISFLNIFLDINRLDPYALSHKEPSSARSPVKDMVITTAWQRFIYQNYSLLKILERSLVFRSATKVLTR